MNAWMVAGRRWSVAACVRASAAASPVSPGLNCITRLKPRSESQLDERLAFAFRHLESENPRDRRPDIQGPDRPLGAGAPWDTRSESDQPHATTRFVSAPMVGKPVAGHVAVASHFWHHHEGRPIAVLLQRLRVLPEFVHESIGPADRVEIQRERAI